MIKSTSEVMPDSWMRRCPGLNGDLGQEICMEFDDCAEDDLSEPEMLMTRAKALSDKGRYEEAAALYDRAIEVTPADFAVDIAIASAEKGKAMERAGLHIQALEALKWAIEIGPEDAETLHYRDLALMSLRPGTGASRRGLEHQI